MDSSYVGLDIAKHVFQIHLVDATSAEIESLQVRRKQLLDHFANKRQCVIGIEACGGSQHWGRELQKLGHTVRLLPAATVKPFVGSNKNDVADARAIWTAVQQPCAKTVAVKTEPQQAVLAIHRVRSQLIKFRTAHLNGFRGLVAEFGEVLPQGRAAIARGAPAVLARLVDRLPMILIETLRQQLSLVTAVDVQIEAIEERLKTWHKSDASSRRLSDVPGVGILTATAAVATMGDPHAFRSGREFAAWLGLVPRQTGSGGRVRLHGISKRGDVYLRTLLIHGARAALLNSKRTSAWAQQLAQRRPRNVAIVALANKMARTIWAMTRHERLFEPQRMYG